MRVIFIGFGTVVQGLTELLIEKKDELSNDYGLDIVVVGISDKLKGSLFSPTGIDLSSALNLAKEEKALSQISDIAYEGDALSLIQDAEADVMVVLRCD